MNDLHRINLPDLLDERGAQFRRRVSESLADLRSSGVLVPDTCLQAITDANENYQLACDVGIGEAECRRFLFDLLDALTPELTKENKT